MLAPTVDIHWQEKVWKHLHACILIMFFWFYSKIVVKGSQNTKSEQQFILSIIEHRIIGQIKFAF